MTLYFHVHMSERFALNGFHIRMSKRHTDVLLNVILLYSNILFDILTPRNEGCLLQFFPAETCSFSLWACRLYLDDRNHIILSITSIMRDPTDWPSRLLWHQSKPHAMPHKSWSMNWNSSYVAWAALTS